MSNLYKPLEPAVLTYDDQGTPFSRQYDDIYHARLGALAQAEHVFLRGNDLPMRWRGRAAFTVCETGFGLGHNFLSLWQAWRHDAHRAKRLHVVSIEAHPFCRDDLARVWRSLPSELAGLASELLAQWPPLLPGLHRLELEGGALTLTLAFGDIRRMAFLIEANVDAFFLDGFDPRKNPEMWSPEVFGQLVRIANRGATAATWCSAGPVRRALANAGFLVERVTGFGSKRVMTTARLRAHMGRVRSEPYAASPILIVGGGLAGAGIAHSLALRGVQSLVIDPIFKNGRGASHAGHLAAGLTPLLSRDDDLRGRLSRAGVQRALQRWSNLPPHARPLRCGTVKRAHTEQERHDMLATLEFLKFPAGWVGWLEPAEAQEKAGAPCPFGGLYFADGQMVRPGRLVESLLSAPEINCMSAEVMGLQRDHNAWLARGQDGEVLASGQHVVLANAGQASGLLRTALKGEALPGLAAMHQLVGQVNYYPAAAAQKPSRSIVSGDGYWLPAVDGLHVGGSTYAWGPRRSIVTREASQEVDTKVAALLGIESGIVEAWRLDAARLGWGDGWAGMRAVAPGRLPQIGRVDEAEGLWLACAYGSRGLTWSALAGDLIAATLCGEPAIIERDLARAIRPR